MADPEATWPLHAWLGFLAEASDLLAGTLDPEMVPAITAQIVVPRLATWCAVHMVDSSGHMALAYVWHTDETRLDSLRLEVVRLPRTSRGLVAGVGGGVMLALPLVARGREIGMLCLGRPNGFPDGVVQLGEDVGRRAALALDNARLYARQVSANRALQRSLLPPSVPPIPGVEHSVVYAPAGEINEVGGDFYDLFASGTDRWRFAIGDVCGTGPEAAAVTGLARHTLRLLAREGYGVADVVAKLNRAIIEDAPRDRFLTLLCGEIAVLPDGLRLSLVSAGHPLPLRLSSSGEVETVASPQSLLGVFDEADFAEEIVDLARGDVLLAVTDGVTERRSGRRLLDDDDGLAIMLASCAGFTAGSVAERVRRGVQEFAPEPPGDDMAILVLRAV